uniref:Cytochrome b n=1 Tax=Polyacanthorhynchus caballeroi TaxID=178082 RepID=A0A140DJ79_9BILA|nr:cytochrome b [Polyacanthorhynchus caballeroi]AMK47833.1 cytochrome b [Polyacanthorhynchus caballeroi]
MVERLILGVKGSLLDIPVPLNLNYWYGGGFMLGMVYGVQLLSGIVLSMYYSVDMVSGGYGSVVMVMQDVCGGWVVRMAHSVGASVMFLLLYLHVGRSFMYGGVKSGGVWLSGVCIMMVMMAVAFLGYVLPWGQMSYWGMTVVTSMLGAFPVVGPSVVEWLWGADMPGSFTLVRFYSFHYFVSLGVAVVLWVHMLVLHESGGSNPLGVCSLGDKVEFGGLYVSKDGVGFVWLGWLYWVGIFVCGYSLMDETNFGEVDFLSTPSHIKPEWYFLYAYCILRSVGSKLGGVVLMFGAIGVLVVFSFSWGGFSGVLVGSVLGKILVVFLVFSFVMLVYLGGESVEAPFSVLGSFFTFMYFLLILLMSLIV